MPTYYHVSPERFDVIRPRYSRKFKSEGLFLSPNKRAIIESWGQYVLEKRNRARRLKRESLIQENGERRKTLNPDPQESEGFQTLYMYAIQIPHRVEKIVQDLYKGKQSEAIESDGISAYGAWGWDAEVFVPTEYISDLKIEGCKKLSREEFQKWSTKHELERLRTAYPGSLDQEAAYKEITSSKAMR